MKPFLDDTMNHYNSRWPAERGAIESLVPRILEGVAATTDVYGNAAGRKYSGDQFERALNRAVFEVQAYYFSSKRARSAASHNKKKALAMFKELCADPEFRGTIEATTKSIANYKLRFDKYRAALGRVIGETLDALPLGRE
jgi:hypothetical protein